MPVRELESQSLRLNIVVLLDLSDRIADETQRDRDQAIIRAITSRFVGRKTRHSCSWQRLFRCDPLLENCPLLSAI